MREDSGSDVLIPGMPARNRAVHGDLVVGHTAALNQVVARKLLGTSEVKVTEKLEGDECAFKEVGKGDKRAGKLLVIPWDYRIPKIRISTRQSSGSKSQSSTYCPNQP
ncbi:hypothetical protein DPMN_114703 [Dreissena polymorpha]|uniref:Uncharacterized protein n=1 Tax=Dreissena polymorpha TaxID=45954 RepID=A0A9D4QS04_DREPO|nr:hypothetical protein DPMN_114703 [Dreissena polymorpha]